VFKSLDDLVYCGISPTSIGEDKVHPNFFNMVESGDFLRKIVVGFTISKGLEMKLPKGPCAMLNTARISTTRTHDTHPSLSYRVFITNNKTPSAAFSLFTYIKYNLIVCLFFCLEIHKLTLEGSLLA